MPVEHFAEDVGISKVSQIPSSNLGWTDLINESVHTADDEDIGYIEAVSKDIIVKRGFVNVRRYYIPIHKVEGWGDNVLWLKITEEQVKKKL